MENKLIAEFLGIQLEQDQERLFIKGLGSKLIDETFDTDWNWLMYVVDKIEGLNFSVEMNRQEDGDYQCLIVKKEIIVQTFSSNKMESVYQAVVNFIRWYNEQK